MDILGEIFGAVVYIAIFFFVWMTNKKKENPEGDSQSEEWFEGFKESLASSKTKENSFMPRSERNSFAVKNAKSQSRKSSYGGSPSSVGRKKKKRPVHADATGLCSEAKKMLPVHVTSPCIGNINNNIDLKLEHNDIIKAFIMSEVMQRYDLNRIYARIPDFNKEDN